MYAPVKKSNKTHVLVVYKVSSGMSFHLEDSLKGQLAHFTGQFTLQILLFYCLLFYCYL